MILPEDFESAKIPKGESIHPVVQVDSYSSKIRTALKKQKQEILGKV